MVDWHLPCKSQRREDVVGTNSQVLTPTKLRRNQFPIALRQQKEL